MPASIVVHYMSDSLALAGVATNLSRSGLFVESELLDVVGTKADISLSDGARQWKAARGEVVRVVMDEDGAPGMGIRFLQLGPGASSWIGHYCDAFMRQVRLLVSDARHELLASVEDEIRSAGGAPLSLAPELLSVGAVTRLRPQAVIIGHGFDSRRLLALVDGLGRAKLLPDAPIYLADDLFEPIRSAAIEAGAAGLVSLTEAEELRQIVDDASRRFDRRADSTFWDFGGGRAGPFVS